MSEYLDRLKCFNDPEFTFDPKYHKYTYKGTPYTSVTKFIENFHPEFEQDYWSKKKAEEKGVDQSEILKEWQDLNDYANEVGNSTHNWIENYYNRIFQELPTNLDIIDRINKFNKIHATHLYKLKPIVTEIRIFSKKYPLAGTIDSLFSYKNKLIIIDHKTNKKFTDDSNNQYNKLLPPFDEYYENHHSKYSIQISLYATILKEWGFDVAAGYLLYIGPNDDAKLIKCHNMIKTIEDFLPTNKKW